MTLYADADTYHADEFGDVPTLSNSIANLLITKSPAHAWAAHPKLNPDLKRVEDVKFDIGTAAHALLLEGEAAVHIVNALDWRTNAAKDERDEARSAGKIPLLAHQWEDVVALCAVTRKQLDMVDAHPPIFKDGSAERTVVWQEGGVWCRARLDWLRDDLTAIDDYKTTSASANPVSWARTMFGMGADVQVAFYLRALRALRERETSAGQATQGSRSPSANPEFRFVVQETYPPYALSVVTLSPAALEVANAKVEYALSVWEQCLVSDQWPAYNNEIAFVESQPWDMQRWLEVEA